jgi:uncharacterized protein YdeI (YjbR/CyaY-like superfamily)
MSTKRSHSNATMPPSPLDIPDDLASALNLDPALRARFDAMPPSHRNEYLSWINEAKRADTRVRRIQQTVERMRSR